MKTLILSLLISLAMFLSAFGQDLTGEIRVTVNPETGDTTFTQSVIISQTEDITPRNSMIVINPLKFLLFYNISYFHKISDALEKGLRYSYILLKTVFFVKAVSLGLPYKMAFF